MADDERTPRTATQLYGHSQAEAMLLRDLAAGTLAHGWLITGPAGIGKATLAYRFARALLSCHSERAKRVEGSGAVSERSFDSGLAASAQDDGVAQRIAAGSHTDLLVVEPLYDPKKEEYAREISVEQAREISQFLALTPAEGQWRVVIVDSIDALNVNAANAILKILEEPPKQAVLLLISHNPGRLLPTIRSRCRSLRLAPLAQQDFNEVMRLHAPDLRGEELAALAQLSGQSPGVALMLHAQGALDIYAQLLALVAALPQLSPLAVHGFAERMGGARAHAGWQLFSRLMPALLERTAAYAAGAGKTPVSGEELEAWRALGKLHPAGVWAAKWQQATGQFSLAERLHLDYKQVIIAFFHSLGQTEPMQIGA